MQERRHKIETLSTMFIAITYGLIFPRWIPRGFRTQLKMTSLHHAQETAVAEDLSSYSTI